MAQKKNPPTLHQGCIVAYISDVVVSQYGVECQEKGATNATDSRACEGRVSS